MKIAIVTDTYFPRINGVAVSTRIFAQEFTRLGHEVHVHAPSFPKQGRDEETFKVIRYPSMYLLIDPEDRLAYGFRKQAREFIAQKYDIVHTQTPFFLGQLALRWAHKSGAKVVHTYHTFYRAYSEFYFRYLPNRLRTYCTNWFSKKYCNSCDLIIAPSPQMADEVLSYKVKTKISIIPTGVSLHQFGGANAERARQQFNFGPRAKIFLYVGRLAKEKNIEFILRVFKRLSLSIDDAYLLIAGAGPSLEKLTKLAQDLQIVSRVKFLGYIKGEQLRNCYAAADLFLFSSVTETQGLAVLEALAAGTPVVAVGRMGINDIFNGGLGGLTTEPDEEEFFQAAMRMISDSNLYRQKKSETVVVAQKWSSETMADRTLEEYSKLLASD